MVTGAGVVGGKGGQGGEPLLVGDGELSGESLDRVRLLANLLAQVVAFAEQVADHDVDGWKWAAGNSCQP